MDAVKLFMSGLIGAIVTYLKPIYNPVTVLAFVFTLDILFGVMVDIILNKDRIRIKKFLISVAFLTLYLLIIASTFFIGKQMGDMNEALYIVKILTYVFSYFYVSNSIRNMRQLAPASKPLAFLDYFIGLQVIKKLPELALFLGLTEKKDKKL